MNTDTARPNVETVPGGAARCPECGHDESGRTDWFARLTARITRRNPVSCATFSREAAMDDVLYCPCTNTAHHVIVPTELHTATERL